jgi:hypothetical protein
MPMVRRPSRRAMIRRASACASHRGRPRCHCGSRSRRERGQPAAGSSARRTPARSRGGAPARAITERARQNPKYPRDRIPISKTSSLQSHRQMGVVMRACCSLYAASHLRRARASQRGPLEYAPRACARYGVLVVGEEMKGLVSPAPKSESRRTDSLIDKRLEIAPIQPERILL